MTYLRRAGRECKLNFRSHLKLNWFIYIIRGKYWFYFAADKWLGWRLAKAEQNALHRSAACLVITLHDNHLARIFIKHRNYYIHHNEDKKAHINRRFRVAKSATASKNGTEALLWKQKVLKTILCTKKYSYSILTRPTAAELSSPSLMRNDRLSVQGCPACGPIHAA